jgi:hypothetical protein
MATPDRLAFDAEFAESHRFVLPTERRTLAVATATSRGKFTASAIVAPSRSRKPVAPA